MNYAINIADLTRFKDDLALSFLLGPVLDREQPIYINSRRWDEVGARLDGDEERIQAVVALLRLKFKKHELRIYRSRTGHGGWKRI
jgi:hypothetical protein